MSDILSVISQQPSTSTVPVPSSEQSSTARDDTQHSIVRNQVSASHVPPRCHDEGFAGESSINHALQEIESYLTHVRELHLHPGSSASREASLLSPPSPHDNPSRPGAPKILRNRGIVSDAHEWSLFVQIFCDEVHILFPFLHLPTLWKNHTTMCNDFSLTRSFDNTDITADNTFMIAQTWICIAIGKCTASPRSNAQDGKHASGWSLYEASSDLIRDLFYGFRDCSDQLLVLQTLALMVRMFCPIYIFFRNAVDELFFTGCLSFPSGRK